MKLRFEFLIDDDRLKNKIGEFEIKNLNISIEDKNIDYDRVDLLIDGEEYDGSISNFTRYMTEEDLFRSVLNAYLMGSPNFKFLDGWDIFNGVLQSKTIENSIIISFSLIESDEIVKYNLLLAVPDARFYCGGYDYYIMLNEDNEIRTDVEAFWFSALIDTLADIRLGKKVVEYKSDDLDETEYENLIQEAIQEKERE